MCICVCEGGRERERIVGEKRGMMREKERRTEEKSLLHIWMDG